ncbi:MAG: CDP-alcohol phosphatidyltransferase family protein [Candidatus Aenigmarchaeota archaeon]|nr:CDP-alcohol phosphatidyltransferase family protein [Candidatus Aenigmarchaeota archaeon]
MLYAKRDEFTDVTKKIGKIFKLFGLSPNQWTALSVISGLIGFLLLMNQKFYLSFLSFTLASLLDLVDGAVAREMKMQTKTGAYFDTISDRIVEFFLILGLLLQEYPKILVPAKLWIFILLFGSLMTTYSKSAAYEKKLMNKELKGGLLERGERMILLLLIILTTPFNRFYAAAMISITSILSITTFIQRTLKALKMSKVD